MWRSAHNVYDMHFYCLTYTVFKQSVQLLLSRQSNQNYGSKLEHYNHSLKFLTWFLEPLVLGNPLEGRLWPQLSADCSSRHCPQTLSGYLWLGQLYQLRCSAIDMFLWRLSLWAPSLLSNDIFTSCLQQVASYVVVHLPHITLHERLGEVPSLHKKAVIMYMYMYIHVYG